MVSLRDGKSYELAAETTASNRRRSSAAGAGRARRSTRAAAAPEQPPVPEQLLPGADQESDQEAESPPAPTPARPRGGTKRARPSAPRPASARAAAAAAAATDSDLDDDDDDLGEPDVGASDQGPALATPLRGAPAPGMDGDEPSPSSQHASKKARLPTAEQLQRAPSPARRVNRRAASGPRLLPRGGAAAALALLAAVAALALLPACAPHRAWLADAWARSPAAARLQPLADAGAQALRVLEANLLELVVSAAASGQQQLDAVLLQLHVRWPSLLPPGGLQQLLYGGPGAPADAPGGAWAPEVLASVLPDGSHWQELAHDIAERLRTPALQRAHKATALLLACGSADDCNEATTALSVLPPRGDACALALHAGELAGPQPAAVLQARLVPFLRRCPAGLVVLRGAEALPVAAVPALHNALSELGGFQHDGGVDASRAAFALLLQQPAQLVAAAAAAPDSAAADGAVKAAFFGAQQAQLSQARAETRAAGADAEARARAAAEAGDAAGQEEAAQAARAASAAQAGWDAVERALTTLHRRLDFAAPVRLGDAARAAAEGEAADDADEAPAPAYEEEAVVFREAYEAAEAAAGHAAE